MKTRLVKFRVQNFRSIEDSGWIDINDVSCLVGTNESGKTNLLLALWKLNPANGEKIKPLVDYPRKQYSEYDSGGSDKIFISARFEFDQEVIDDLVQEFNYDPYLFEGLIIHRKFNERYYYSYEGVEKQYVDGEDLGSIYIEALKNLQESPLQEKEEKESINKLESFLQKTIDSLGYGNIYSTEYINSLQEAVDGFLKEHFSRKVNIKRFFEEEIKARLEYAIDKWVMKIDDFPESLKVNIKKQIPAFVYYSDYGNLDSEIYLPHVVDNFDRPDLGEKEQAKARSLKVLFDFVKLSPHIILEYGRESRDTYQSESNIENTREKKKERSILLESASNRLSDSFAEWWKQGEYRFRFDADGNHFRIWVSDDKRNESIELESRSRGLQWFFSFFLVFLVESKGEHAGCILLLDEPGLSLHPVAQLDLIKFFNSLAQDNQLIYTTHSPFLVDPDNLGSVYASFVDDNGKSVMSKDLRSNQKLAERSLYPIHAAIGITVSETLLYGCQPVLVEGTSDQIYLQLIKKYVLASGKYKNDKEIVFIPTGGVKGMKPVINIVQGREEKLPFVILDADKQGKEKQKHLEKELYADDKKKLISINDFLGEGSFEIEDIMPKEELARIFARQYRAKNTEEDFDYWYKEDEPIVNQMEAFAKENDYTLPPGWKVDLAKDVQRNFDKITKKADKETQDNWVKLIKKLTS